jgi:HSP20 family protein
MYETDDEVVVKTAVPGIRSEDIDISITRDILTIQGGTKAEEKVDKANYIRQERRYGAFARQVCLPETVVAEEATAGFEVAVLTLALPEAEEAQPKAIRIKAKGK